jgi:hypothetical protein
MQSKELGQRLCEEISKPKGECDIQKVLNLIHQGADTTIKDNVWGVSPEQWCCINDHAELIGPILKAQGKLH